MCLLFSFHEFVVIYVFRYYKTYHYSSRDTNANMPAFAKNVLLHKKKTGNKDNDFDYTRPDNTSNQAESF